MIGSCPECNEAIRVPQGSADQKVRCPLCNSEYELSDVFNDLPPLLEVIGSSASIGIQLESSDKSRTQSDQESKLPNPPNRSYQPQKRQQSSLLMEFTKVIFGGLLAIPVGLLCIWWLAGRAPFGVAEPIGNYVPWIVPEHLRDTDELNDEPPKNSELNNPNNRSPRKSANLNKPTGGNLSHPLPPSNRLGIDPAISDPSNAPAQENQPSDQFRSLPQKRP
ncbi:MAG: hypothetical protein VX438_18705 [Planctomycetota bacterium]|nr:hypothetical protein [Planctomycetota bacterium]